MKDDALEDHSQRLRESETQVDLENINKINVILVLIINTLHW